MGIFIGLVVGALFAAGTAWYFTRLSPFNVAPSAARSDAERPLLTLPGKPGDRPLVNKDFDFYQILPKGSERESAAATAPEAAPAPAPAPAPVEQATKQSLYLQVGAFEDPGEADNMKALLALNGINANSQLAQLDDGRTVHRVRIGPFARPEEMNPVRSRLASAGLTAAVVRVGQ